MKQYIPAFALAFFVACSSGGDTPADNGDNGDNGDNDPPPVALPTAVQQAMEACGFDQLATLLTVFESFADLVQPPGVADDYTVIIADTESGLFELELGFGNAEPPPVGTLTIADPEAGVPEGLDLSPLMNSLDGLAGILAGSTGVVDVNLLVSPIEGVPGGTLFASFTDGAVTRFEANLEVFSPTCALSVQAIEVPGTAFAGAYPDMTIDTIFNLTTSEGDVRAETEFTFDGTAVASAEVSIEGETPFTILIDLETGAVTLAP
jgi:hypothetical protein